MSQYRKLLSVAFATFCLMGALVGRAEAVQIKQHSLEQGYQTKLRLNYSSDSMTYFAGSQSIQIDNDDILLAFCIDPHQIASTSNNSYQVSTDFEGYFSPSSSDAADVAKLYSLYYSSTLDSDVHAAGFQLALWELVGDSTKNLTKGNVRAVSGTRSDVKSMAQSMLDGLQRSNWGTDTYTFTPYTSDKRQDFLVATLQGNQVPEPQSIALMALALGLLTVAVRRQR